MTKDTSRKDEPESMSRSDQDKGRKQQGGQSGSGGKQQQQQNPGSQRQPGGGNSDDTRENVRDRDVEGNRGGRNPQVDVERE
jgi:hypothetical protein